MSGQRPGAKNVKGLDPFLAFSLQPLSLQPLFLKLLIFFAEPFNSAGRVYQFLFSGKKRMAFGTDFDMNIGLCGSNLKIVATRTFNNSFRIRRMNRRFHYSGELPIFGCLSCSFRIKHSWNLKSLYYSLFRSFFQVKIQGCPQDLRKTAIFAESRPDSMSHLPEEALLFGSRIS